MEQISLEKRKKYALLSRRVSYILPVHDFCWNKVTHHKINNYTARCWLSVVKAIIPHIVKRWVFFPLAIQYTVGL